MLLFLSFLLLALGIQAGPHHYSIRTKDPAAFAMEYGLKHIASVGGYEIFEDSSSTLHTRLESIPNLHREIKRKQYKRSKDPLYPQQWHLHDSPYAVGEVSGATGKGVTLAIVDDGLESTHGDLRGNFNTALSYDFNGHKSDPTPTYWDAHGTACGGVCCASENNGVCGKGVAPEASLVGIRLIAGTVYDYEEAQGLTHKRENIRIYSNSWGPMDSGRDMMAPGRIVKQILQDAWTTGGHNIYVWAGGNGRENQDSSNYDGYANSPYTLAIGALDYRGYQSYYSESGANLLAVTPSSGAGKGITTVDLQGSAGYSPTECTSDFGGTSSAAPLAAGIFALLLEARPELGARDIQHIVASHAYKQLIGGSWSLRNARGYSHSNEFGFGLLKVAPLLEAAKKYQVVVGTQKSVKIHQVIPNVALSTNVRLTAPSSLSFIEQVLVTVKMTHARRGQVAVSISSKQTQSLLASYRDDSNSGPHTWTYKSLRHWGEELQQGDVWQVDVIDTRPYDTYKGTLQEVEVEFMGF